MENAEKLPPWIDPLLWSTFFDGCSSHSQWYGKDPRRGSRSGGCNILCIDCCTAICCRCTREERHRGHRTIQIRLSSFQNVVKVTDIKPFFDVAQVQTHVINGCRVVCINKRPKTTARWPGDGASTSVCKVCSRVLRGIYTFCSIECKVCDYAPAAQGQTPEETTVAMMSKATMTVMSGARKRTRKATPQRAHLGCTL